MAQLAAGESVQTIAQGGETQTSPTLSLTLKDTVMNLGRPRWLEFEGWSTYEDSGTERRKLQRELSMDLLPLSL